MTVDVIMTVQGASEGTTRAIERSPALLGWETGNTDPLPNANVEFLDWPFTHDDPSLEDHIAAAKEHRPRYAVAPDIEGDWTLDRVLDAAAELDEYAETVIVVPKAVPPNRVPDRYRLGLPNQPAWGSDGSWPKWEYADRRVHVLGGSPTDQREEVGAYTTVGSVDGANVAAYAKYGRIWTPTGQIEQPGRSYYERIEASLTNVWRAWNEPGEENCRECGTRLGAGYLCDDCDTLTVQQPALADGGATDAE